MKTTSIVGEILKVYCVVTDIACVIKTEMGHIAVSGVEGQTEVSHGPHASPVMQAWSYLVLLWILTSDCTLVLSPCHPRCQAWERQQPTWTQ